MSKITVTAFRWVPPFAQGLVRDLRVRWALEECGLSYDTNLIGREDQQTPAYRALQPFGQVPAYQEDDLVLFESAAIVHHIAQRSDALMPKDAAGRARVLTWMFTAMNTVEPHVQNLTSIDLFYANEEWAKLRRPGALDMAKSRLKDLAAYLDGKDYLDGNRFTAADLLMTTVLRILRHTDLVAQYPVLKAYQERCEARPAFKKALADQMAPFAENAP